MNFDDWKYLNRGWSILEGIWLIKHPLVNSDALCFDLNTSCGHHWPLDRRILFEDRTCRRWNVLLSLHYRFFYLDLTWGAENNQTRDESSKNAAILSRKWLDQDVAALRRWSTSAVGGNRAASDPSDGRTSPGSSTWNSPTKPVNHKVMKSSERKNLSPIS